METVPCPYQLSLPTGWKLNPVVGAVYGPEFYAGNVGLQQYLLRVPPKCQLCTVSATALCSEQLLAPLPVLCSCLESSPYPIPLPSIPTGPCPCQAEGTGVGSATDALWGLCGLAVESPQVSLPSCSNGVPIPHHGNGRGLPRGTPTGTRTRRLQHLPGRATATAHPHLRRVSTRGGCPCAAPGLRWRRRALACWERAAAPAATAWP